VGAILASFTSMAFSLTFVLRMREPTLIRRLVLSMAAVAVCGAMGLLLGHLVQPWVQWLITGLERGH
jgi:hypothetical protein